jgi:hypothetical protein
VIQPIQTFPPGKGKGSPVEDRLAEAVIHQPHQGIQACDTLRAPG